MFRPFIITSIAGLSTILGNVLLFINSKYKDNVLCFSLGLSFSVMFLISILELVPEGIGYMYGSIPNINVFIIGLFLLLLGYFIVSFIYRNISNEDELYKIGILSMISLLIHNIPEGIICSLSSYLDYDLGIKMSFMIMVHNIPEGICISLPVYYSTGSRGKAFIMSLVSAFGEIFGAFIGLFILRNFINGYIMSFILIITAGIMITLSVSKILKKGIDFKRYKWLILGILFGISIIYFTL